MCELWKTFTRTPHPDYPEVSIFSNIKENGEFIGNPPEDGTWHSDFFYHRDTAAGSMFYAKEVPPEKGDTHFAGMTAAYAALPEKKKAQIDSLMCNYSLIRDLAIVWPDRPVPTPEQQAATPDVKHPIVRTHPVTQRKALFVNENFTTRIEGLGKIESDAMLKMLFDHIAMPEFQCRFRWREKSVAFWDNRCAQHRTVWDYYPQVRHGYRVTIAGDKPF